MMVNIRILDREIADGPPHLELLVSHRLYVVGRRFHRKGEFSLMTPVVRDRVGCAAAVLVLLILYS